VDLRRINDDISVSPQIAPADLPGLRAAGFTTIINNRPDGEAPDQPDSAAMAAAAAAAGLAYHYIPLGRDGVTEQMIAATAEAIAASAGPVLAFCRSGTRSTTLWALSQAGRLPADEIVAQAAGAGYDVSHLLGHLTRK